MPLSCAVNKIHENKQKSYSQTMNIIINNIFWIINDCEYDYVTSLKGRTPVNLVTLAAMLGCVAKKLFMYPTRLVLPVDTVNTTAIWLVSFVWLRQNIWSSSIATDANNSDGHQLQMTQEACDGSARLLKVSLWSWELTYSPETCIEDENHRQCRWIWPRLAVYRQCLPCVWRSTFSC